MVNFTFYILPPAPSTENEKTKNNGEISLIIGRNFKINIRWIIIWNMGEKKWGKTTHNTKKYI